ncbi:MAG: helix-turn-helix transcriptional regulator [Synergistaceae bacterium]|nr:helix-turn-helix transcriptional regulator [Synergistaceae bacterium]
MLGIPAATLSNIFAEKTKPTLSIAMKINESFPNISLEWLLTGKGSHAATCPSIWRH